MSFHSTSSYEQVTMKNVSDSTPQVNVDIEEFEYLDDVNTLRYQVLYKYSLPFILVFGMLTTPFPLTILIRRRMWLRHEGYFYLTAYLVANLVKLVVVFLPKTLYFFNTRWHFADTSEAACKIWSFLMHVINSSDWLPVAMLVDVLLRYHLQSPPGKFGCRNFAAKYRTLFGAKFITALVYVASVMVNWWCLVTAHLFHYGDDEYICHLSVMWYEELWLWRFISSSVTQFIPVVIVTPVLCLTVVLFARRDGSQVTAEEDSMDADVEEDANELTRLSVGVGATVSLLKYPHYLLEMIVQTRRLTFYHEVYAAWYATELILSVHLFLVPVLCIGLLRETRAALRSIRLDSLGQRRF